MKNNPYIGSSLDELLSKDNILAEVEAVALKRVLAWQIEQAMLEKGLTKTEMAKVMNTSGADLDCLLDPNNTFVTLNIIERAANALGKRLQFQLIDTEI